MRKLDTAETEAEGGDLIDDYSLGTVIVAMAIGVLCRAYLTRVFHLPHTVLKLTVGVAVGYFLQSYHGLGSYDDMMTKWVNIDSQIIMVLFIPIYIFDTALQTDMHILRREFWQVLLLAGPGTVLAMLLTAAITKYWLPYDWDWTTCLMFGSILSATDPAAILALLKELSVSQRLAARIEGESLFNDAVAIVCFSIFQDSLRTVDAEDGSQTASNASRLALGGAALGIVAGMVGGWVLGRVLDNALSETSILLLLCYGVYLLAEATELKVSGVLTLVTLCLCLAYYSGGRSSMGDNSSVVIKMLTYISSTMIFFSSGLIVGDTCLGSAPIDGKAWGYLLVLYIGLNLARAAILLLFAPLLMTGAKGGIDWRQMLVMAIGSLRGALSLPMALIVQDNQLVDGDTAILILFFTAGISALTMVINWNVTKPLLTKLGMDRRNTMESEVFIRACSAIERRLEHQVDLLKGDRFVGDADWEAVWRYVPVVTKKAYWYRIRRGNIILSETEEADVRRAAEGVPPQSIPERVCWAARESFHWFMGRVLLVQEFSGGSHYTNLPRRLRYQWYKHHRTFHISPTETNEQMEQAHLNALPCMSLGIEEWADLRNNAIAGDNTGGNSTKNSHDNNMFSAFNSVSGNGNGAGEDTVPHHAENFRVTRSNGSTSKPAQTTSSLEDRFNEDITSSVYGSNTLVHMNGGNTLNLNGGSGVNSRSPTRMPTLFSPRRRERSNNTDSLDMSSASHAHNFLHLDLTHGPSSGGGNEEPAAVRIERLKAEREAAVKSVRVAERLLYEKERMFELTSTAQPERPFSMKTDGEEDGDGVMSGVGDSSTTSHNLSVLASLLTPHFSWRRRFRNARSRSASELKKKKTAPVVVDDMMDDSHTILDDVNSGGEDRDVVAEARVRFLSAAKANYQERFHRGWLGLSGLHVLQDNIDSQLDSGSGGAVALAEWADLASSFDIPATSLTTLRRMPLLGKLIEPYIYRRLAFIFELASNFIGAHEDIDILELINEGPAAYQLAYEKNKLLREARDTLAAQLPVFPELARSLKTQVAARYVLVVHRGMLEELFQHGHIEEAEYEKLLRENSFSRTRLHDHPHTDHIPPRSQLLRDVPFLHFLSDEQKEQVIQSVACMEEFYGSNITLMREWQSGVKGHRRSGWYVVVRGSVRQHTQGFLQHASAHSASGGDDSIGPLSFNSVINGDTIGRHADGPRPVLVNRERLLHAGTVFGLDDQLLDIPYHSTYVTASFAHLFFFDKALMLQMAEAMPKLSRGLWWSLAVSVVRHQKGFRRMSLKDVYQVMTDAEFVQIPSLKASPESFNSGSSHRRRSSTADHTKQTKPRGNSFVASTGFIRHLGRQSFDAAGQSGAAPGVGIDVEDPYTRPSGLSKTNPQEFYVGPGSHILLLRGKVLSRGPNSPAQTSGITVLRDLPEGWTEFSPGSVFFHLPIVLLNRSTSNHQLLMHSIQSLRNLTGNGGVVEWAKRRNRDGRPSELPTAEFPPSAHPFTLPSTLEEDRRQRIERDASLAAKAHGVGQEDISPDTAQHHTPTFLSGRLPSDSKETNRWGHSIFKNTYTTGTSSQSSTPPPAAPLSRTQPLLSPPTLRSESFDRRYFNNVVVGSVTSSDDYSSSNYSATSRRQNTAATSQFTSLSSTAPARSNVTEEGGAHRLGVGEGGRSLLEVFTQSARDVPASDTARDATEYIPQQQRPVGAHSQNVGIPADVHNVEISEKDSEADVDEEEGDDNFF